jgi:two-component system OmpR family sensor kinase
MGRLFWKFFLVILLAQLVAMLGVGATFWLRDQVTRTDAERAMQPGGPDRFRLAPPMFKPGAPPPGAPDMRRPPGRGHHLPYISMAVGTLASLLFAALLAWYIARPIRALRAAFDAAASGDLAPRFGAVKPGRGNELTALGHAFDRMSGQLRGLMDNQRRLLHDVSHELRSPLARLQAAIGLAHQQPDKLGASLDRIERESVRMDRLVGELLALARLDSATSLPPAEEIGMLELVDEIAADARFEAEQSGRDVVVNGAGNPKVRGAPDLLWRGIENIVRNAIKHSPEGGVVEVGVAQQAGQVRICVQDRGPGVEPAHLASIFQPFFRSNPGDNNIDGHGLGLAIAQRVIGAHGGTVRANNRAGGGLCVTISLPALAPSTDTTRA